MGKDRIAIGCDHAGFELKEKIVEYLKYNQIEYKDFGSYTGESCDYPVVAAEIAKEVSERNFEKGILVCGSGIGMSIAANRFKGVRAALCFDLFTAKSSRTHNHSNILCLGQRVTEMDLAMQIVDIWLHTEEEGGRHQARVDMIESL